MSLQLNIPEDSPVGQAIPAIVAEQHVTPEEAVEKMLADKVASLGQQVPVVKEDRRSYASFFGSIKGRSGAHGSKEAVDRYIEELRNEW